MDIEALCVCTIGPWLDVRCPEQRSLGNASHGTAPAPVVQQGVPEYVLANTLDYDPFGLSCSRKAGSLGPKAIERRLRQAYGKLVNAIESDVQFG